MKQIESHPNEESVPYAEKSASVLVKIPPEHWLRNGQTHMIVFHDDTYIERDIIDPHTVHVRKK